MDLTYLRKNDRTSDKKTFQISYLFYVWNSDGFCIPNVMGLFIARFIWLEYSGLVLLVIHVLVDDARNNRRSCAISRGRDEADWTIIVIMSIAATTSLVAIVLELGTLKELEPIHKLLRYGITIATVLGTWFFIATIFTFHYARMYYRSPERHRALIFPDANLQPDYWDFLYFSFTIAVAFQTSDVMLSSRKIRKSALAQSILSFWFNIAILGLSINIAAGLVAQ